MQRRFQKSSQQPASSDPLGDVTPVRFFLHPIAESISPSNLIHPDWRYQIRSLTQTDIFVALICKVQLALGDCFSGKKLLRRSTKKYILFIMCLIVRKLCTWCVFLFVYVSVFVCFLFFLLIWLGHLWWHWHIGSVASFYQENWCSGPHLGAVFQRFVRLGCVPACWRQTNVTLIREVHGPPMLPNIDQFYNIVSSVVFVRVLCR